MPNLLVTSETPEHLSYAELTTKITNGYAGETDGQYNQRYVVPSMLNIHNID